ncbi:MAG: GNAT family N-acetyltransferase [Candidatus ainarchaeum sp.]|nr:GNAT family N-acetyltransferase [Candidatus ainarchaeum sp.]
MNFDLFNIKKVVKEDIPEILKIIDNIFPYTYFNDKTILKKIVDKNFFLIKFVQKNFFVGFAEIEFFPEKKESRLNAVFVSESFRKKGIATKLLQNCINEVKKRHYNIFFLLVKENNFVAKKLYSKSGFCFERFYEKEIDNSIIEMWSIKFD